MLEIYDIKNRDNGSITRTSSCDTSETIRSSGSLDDQTEFQSDVLSQRKHVTFHPTVVVQWIPNVSFGVRFYPDVQVIRIPSRKDIPNLFQDLWYTQDEIKELKDRNNSAKDRVGKMFQKVFQCEGDFQAARIVEPTIATDFALKLPCTQSNQLSSKINYIRSMLPKLPCIHRKCA